MSQENFFSYFERTHPILNLECTLVNAKESVRNMIFILDKISSLSVKPFKKFSLLRQWYHDFNNSLLLLVQQQNSSSQYICYRFYKYLVECIIECLRRCMRGLPFNQKTYLKILSYEQFYVIGNFLKNLFENYPDDIFTTISLVNIKWVTHEYNHTNPIMMYVWLFSIDDIPRPRPHHTYIVDFYSPFYELRRRLPCDYYARVMRTLNQESFKILYPRLEFLKENNVSEQLIKIQEVECLEQELDDTEQAIIFLKDIPYVDDGWKPLPLMILECFILEDTKLKIT